MKTLLKITMVLVFTMFSIYASAQKNSDIKTVVYECSFDCSSCETKVLKNIPYEKGVKDVAVSYEQKLATITYKTSKNTDEGIQKALQDLGYKVQIKGEPYTFSVNGNCGMCKEKIEGAALNVKGVTVAEWDVNKKQINVVFNAPATLNDVHKAIAAVGYDTDKVKADDAVYNNLHSCCKYDR